MEEPFSPNNANDGHRRNRKRALFNVNTAPEPKTEIPSIKVPKTPT